LSIDIWKLDFVHEVESVKVIITVLIRRENGAQVRARRGSIRPEIALVEAAKILRKHLNPFVQFTDLGPEIHSTVRVNTDGVDPAIEKKLNMSIGELHLSVRASNCLEAENILTVRDLITKDEDSLMEVRNFGDTTLHEVNEKLGELGMRLGMRVASQSSLPSL
jgi:DNA-directed RNA polymerase subunit alpha